MHSTRIQEPDAVWRTRFAFAAAGLAMIGIGVFVFRTSFQNQFLGDDLVAIVDNQSIHQLWPPTVKRETPFSARPLVNYSFALNHRFAELEVVSYRVTQTLLHIVAALLLWRILASTLLLPKFANQFSFAAEPLSYAAALLWMLHPVNSETVLYITQRTELLMAIFYFATLGFSIAFWNAASSRRRFVFALLAGSSCSLGILCKETMATAPLVVLLYQWTFVDASPRRIYRTSKWLYLGLMLCWVPITGIYAFGFVTPGGGFGNTVSATDWWLTQCGVVLLYVKLTFWPWPLLIHHEYPIADSFKQAWPSVLLVATMIGGGFWMFCRRWTLGFVVICFFVVLSPTLLIPLPKEVVAERRIYVPLAAIIGWMVVVGYNTAIKAFRRPRLAWVTTTSCVVMLAIGMSILVRWRIVPYRDSFSIWHDVAQRSPTNSLAHMNVGAFLAEEGKINAASPYLRRAIELNPGLQRGHFNYAKLMEVSNRPDEAIEHYRIATELDPDDANSHYNLANLLELQGHIDDAIKHYRRACEVAPRFAAAHTNLAILLAGDQQWDAAVEHFETAFDREADLTNCINLVTAYVRVERRREALSAAQRGVQIATDSGDRRATERMEQLVRKLRSILN